MSWCRDHLKYVILSLCTIAFAGPGIILIALFDHDDITMNTQGYFLPGGNCMESCGFEPCNDVGNVIVSFFEPDNDSGNMITMLISVPIWCLMIARSSCCTELALNHTLVWFYVEVEDGYTVKYVSFEEESNKGNFLVIGICLLLISTGVFAGLIVQIVNRNGYSSV